jgi:hypothetical protein
MPSVHWLSLMRHRDNSRCATWNPMKPAAPVISMIVRHVRSGLFSEPPKLDAGGHEGTIKLGLHVEHKA